MSISCRTVGTDCIVLYIYMDHTGDRKRLQFLAICIINEKSTMNVQMASFDVLASLRVIRKKDEGGGNVAERGVTW